MDKKCKYIFNEDHPDGGGYDSECGLIENLNRDKDELLNDWVTCPCGKIITITEDE